MKLTHPETGHTVHVGQAGAEHWRSRGYRSPDDTTTTTQAAERPAKSAPRGDWDDYARAQGVNPDDYSSKDDLISALED